MSFSFCLQLLKFPLGPCPRYEQLQNQTRQTPEYQNLSLQNTVSGVEVERITWVPSAILVQGPSPDPSPLAISGDGGQ